jgi:NAD(P)-dependent dehydrogenase (short-subunit alcohol dehydrogenase family)
MDLKLAGKNVVVTGSAGLIGSELCQQLADSAANLLLLDISPRNGELCAELVSRHPASTFVSSDLDISREEGAQRVPAIVEHSFGGRIHGLVNAIQYKSQSFFHDLKDTSTTEIQDIFAANVFSIFWMMKHLTPQLKMAGGASVVNLSSTYAIVSPNPAIYVGTALGCPPTYVATKGAVHALTKYLACYLAKDKIRVNSVTPHGVHGNHEDLFIEQFSRLSPLQRLSEKEEIAPAILFLLSEQSSYITGANIKVDGGWTAW